ncbi:hypothetical protein B7R54_19415 [Subtercola boreus]|uniref:Uncharacterized protein n=1 Tax=Subtercola boreus TaxID=120213 RepID=A0A3E0VAA3_9MICO|nr:hypothetical protein B7R54_19415 [Subtercola boreus]
MPDEPFSALGTGATVISTRQSVIDALERSALTLNVFIHDQEEALPFGDQMAVIGGETISVGGSILGRTQDPPAGMAQILGEAVVFTCPIEGRPLGTWTLLRDTTAAARPRGRCRHSPNTLSSATARFAR